MPAVSQKQQKFFGAILGGAIDKPKGMTTDQVKDFAATPRKDLPEHAGKKFYGQGKPPERAKPKSNRFYGET